MRDIRIFHPDPLSPELTVDLSDSAVGHVVRVLRMQSGDTIELFDGHGGVYSAALLNIGKRTVTARTAHLKHEECESPLAVHLAQGVSRGEKMDFTIQKSVELGVTEITPIITERCGVKLDPKRWAKKVEHWQKVAIGACEQCGRNRVPKIHQPMLLPVWLQQPSHQLCLTLHPRNATPISKISSVPEDGVRLLIGPEGGLTDSEIDLALGANYQTTLLGPRILRTETAALSALTALQLKFGDFC